MDAPLRDVVRALQSLGFVIVRERQHISLARAKPDGTHDRMTLTNHRRLKSSTLRTALRQAGISREEFLQAYHRER